MKKYYLMAINKSNLHAMNNLSNYYNKNMENDYDQMKKYYLMAIELEFSVAMNNLICHYGNVKNDCN